MRQPKRTNPAARKNGRLGGRPRELDSAERIGVVLPGDLADALRARAAADGVTLSAAARAAIARGL